MWRKYVLSSKKINIKKNKNQKLLCRVCTALGIETKNLQITKADTMYVGTYREYL
jgi:hypothetical protein